MKSPSRAVTGRLADAATPAPPPTPAAPAAKPAADEPPRESPDDIDLATGVCAVRAVLTAAGTDGLDREDAVRQIATELGFDRLSPKVRDLAESALTAAGRRQVVMTERGRVLLQTRTIDDYEHEERVLFLLAAMRDAGGPGLWDRDEAIKAAAQHLGFRRTGSKIEDAFKSAINGAIRRGLLEAEGKQIKRI